LTTDQKDVFEEWIVRLRDKKAISAIDRRVWRMENGNFGDHKFCRDGVWELRIDVGPGYRVYYALFGQKSFSCCVAETNEFRVRISAAPVGIGTTGKGEAMRDRPHDDAVAERFREDPAYAVELLNDILKDGDQGEVLIALRVMAKAFGGVQSVAEKAQLNPTQL
jgi:putative addiction module killer protein